MSYFFKNKISILFSFILITILFLTTYPTPTHAQVVGTGADVLEPIKGLWQLSRNISYVIMVLILMIIGLMIMFRAKLGQQSVVGLQQALPGVIMALVTITFSFFIASLIVDFAFILSRIFGVVILATLAPGVGGSTATANTYITDILHQKNFFMIFANFIQYSGLSDVAGSLGNFLAPIFEIDLVGVPHLGRLILAAMLGFLFGQIGGVAGLISGGVGAITGAVSPGFAVSILAFVILFLALLYAVFGLFMSIIGSFVSVILSIILGPFMILTAALPGKGGNIMNWLKGLIANVLVFPVLFGLFVLAAVILNIQDTTGQPPWGIYCSPASQAANICKPAVGDFNQSLPLMANLDSTFIRFIIVFGLLLLSPGIADFIRRSLGVAQAQEFTTAIKGNIGSGQKQGSSILGKIKFK